MRLSLFTACLLPIFTLSCACARATNAGEAKGGEDGSAATSAPVRTVDLKDGRAFADVVEATLPSVVSVSSTRTASVSPSRLPFDDPFFERFFGFRFEPPSERREQGLGSGVVMAKDLVLTNNHVIDGADEIKVTTEDDRELDAEVVGTDPKSDLALLRIDTDGKDLKPIRLGDSSRLRLGEVVLAIGNPFGVGQTVTMGIVSATGRSGLGIVDYEGFIQTDAAINPGNSGGALINASGELVGINTAILSRSGGNNGIGFAIPTSMAKPVMDSILEHGKVVRGWLGVVIQELKPEIRDAMGLDVEQGVLVSDVQEDSPAAKAGLQRRDVIVELEGKSVATTAELRNRIAAAGAAKSVKLVVVREKKRKAFTVKLGELPDDATAMARKPSLGKQGTIDGLSVAPLSEELRKKYRIADEVQRGVVVTDVDRGSVAAFGGLRPGDVILEVNRKEVGTVHDLEEAWKAAKGNRLLLVHRRGSTLFVVIKK